jgi:Ca-activated chloride channel family protein
MKLRNLIYGLFSVILLGLGSPQAQARDIGLKVSPGSPYVYAGEKQTIPIKISLNGYNVVSHSKRAPVNVSIVLDRSGSMSGEKLRQAKEAAVQAIHRLNSNDIVSVVTYDHAVNVIVPATKAYDKTSIINKIRSINAGGNTALFAGVSIGVSEIKKFYDGNRVNRVVLLSDGLANVGPSSPHELGELGTSLRRQGISVTTFGLGLGFNEDLMTRLAQNSDGNHAFIENSSDLARIFNLEFGDILSVVAQNVDVIIDCRPDIRPIRVIGRDAEIIGQTVRLDLNQVYANQEKYIVLEVEVPSRTAGTSLELATVRVDYSSMESQSRKNLSSIASISYSDSRELVRKSVDKKTLGDYYQQLTNEYSDKAVELKDQGKTKEAEEVLRSNAVLLKEKAKKYDIPSLEKRGDFYDGEASRLYTDDWKRQRKSIRREQYKLGNQQAY